MAQNKNRLVVVHNPESTHASRVSRRVFDPLFEQGIPFTLHETAHSDTEANIAGMREVFRPGDTIVVAGGDGSKMQAVNAVERNRQQRETQLTFLPFGNYNDLADRNLSILDIANRKYDISSINPMTVEADGEYLLHSPSYLTMGFTALAAARFSEEQTREVIKQLPRPLRKLGNLAELATSYFDLHDYKMPEFHTSESPVVRKAVSDILLLNSKRAGGIIRSHPDYAREDYFGYHEANVANIPASLPFGFSALAGHAIADRLPYVEVNFEQPSTVPVQSEGEFRVLDGVSNITVHKNPADRLTVLRVRK